LFGTTETTEGIALETKTPKKGSTSETATPTAVSAGEYFGEVKEELSKISWTPKEELVVYTKIIVIATFILGMSIYVVDLIIQAALNGLGHFIRLLTV
jgi:preprotein translocase subunit SecE